MEHANKYVYIYIYIYIYILKQKYTEHQVKSQVCVQKLKVKFFATHAIRHIGGMEVQIPLILNLITRWRQVVSLSRPLCHAREPMLVPIKQEASWAPQLILDILEMREIICPSPEVLSIPPGTPCILRINILRRNCVPGWFYLQD